MISTFNWIWATRIKKLDFNYSFYDYVIRDSREWNISNRDQTVSQFKFPANYVYWCTLYHRAVLPWRQRIFGFEHYALWKGGLKNQNGGKIFCTFHQPGLLYKNVNIHMLQWNKTYQLKYVQTAHSRYDVMYNLL